MSSETPTKQRDNLHDEEGENPRFGYSGSPEDVRRQQVAAGDPSDPREQYNPQTSPMGDSSDPRKEYSPSEIADKENTSPDESDASKAESDEAAKTIPFSQEGTTGQFSRLKASVTANPRRKAAAAAVTITVATAGIGGFGIIQGPLKIIHLGELLNLPGRTQSDTNSHRIGNMYRFIRTGAYGETRLGNMESLVNKKMLSDFEKEGIVLEHDQRVGRLSKVSVDPRSNSALKDLSAEERKVKFAETYGVQPENVRTLGNGRLEIDAVGTKTKFKTGIIKASFGLAGKGAASTAVNARIVTKFFGEFSIFHPMKKIEVKLAEADAARTASRAERKNARDEAQRVKNEKTTSSLNKFDKTFLQEQKSKIGDGKNLRLGAGAAVSLTGVLCTIKDITGAIPRLQYLSSVVPAMEGAYSTMGYASQVKAGDDFTAQQAGDFSRTTTNKEGKSVFAAEGINALTGKTGGEPLEPDIKSSFSDENKAASINAFLNKIPLLGAACSPIGTVVQAIVGLGLLVGTGGLATITYKAGSQIVQGVALSRVIDYIEKRIVGPSLAKEVLAGGPLGGNLLAQGAMWAARSRAMNFGGVAFSTVASDQIRAERIAEYKQEFADQSLGTKLLDVTDSRSLAAAVIDNPTLSQTSTLSNVASVFSFNSLLSGIVQLASGKAYAAERSYDWGAPEYGFSSDILDNPKYQDPYDNADKVAKFIDGSDYIDKAETCFGAKIFKEDSGQWNVVTDSDVNPATGDYKNENCADESDANWIRVRLFILDTKNMAAFACLEGDGNNPDVQKACGDAYGQTANDTPQTAVPAVNTEPPDTINGYNLQPNEKEHLKYIAENVLSKLPGNKAQIAAQSAWWALREGVLNLDDPFGYSNCASSGNNHIGFVTPCSATHWQVGIGAVQVPNWSSAQVIAMAKKMNPGKTIKQILAQVAVLAGYNEGTPEYNKAVNSTGSLQTSLLLRDPATGIALVYRDVQPCFGNSPPSWCLGGGRAGVDDSSANISKAVSELQNYFSGATAGGSGGTIVGNLAESSVDVPCASGTKDLGIQNGYSGGNMVKIRICAVSNLTSTSEESHDGYGVTGAGGKAVVNSRVSGAVYAMIQAAKADGVDLSASSSFRTMSHQTSLCNQNSLCVNGDYSRVARPGTSNHQLGVAIDFGTVLPGTAGPVANNKYWDWLSKNAQKYGFKNYPAEAWHWSPTGN